MATSAIAGYRALLAISTSTAGSVSTIAELRDYTIDVSHQEIDVTSHDSSGSREIIAGIDQWSGSGEISYVISNQNHKDMFDVMVNKTKVLFEFYPTGTSGDGWFNGEGYVSNFSMSAPTEDALAASVNFTGNGALTRNSSV